MGLAEVVTEKNLEDCYSVDMNDAVRHGMCVSILSSELASELGMDDVFTVKTLLHTGNLENATPNVLNG